MNFNELKRRLSEDCLCDTNQTFMEVNRSSILSGKEVWARREGVE